MAKIGLRLNVKTVKHWLQIQSFVPRQHSAPESKLTPFKDTIRRWVEQHPLSAQQILRRLREQGYAGGYAILKEFQRLALRVDPLTEDFLRAAPGLGTSTPPRVYVQLDGTGAPLRPQELAGRRGKGPRWESSNSRD